MLELDPAIIRAGDLIGERFRLETIIGEGGMGTVWEATDISNNEKRALKLVRRDRVGDARNEARLLREARALSAIRHDNVARIYEVSELDDGTPFFVMERLTGETLKQRLARRERLEVPEAIAIARAVADGVAAAHEAGIVHRDLKPDNVFIDRGDRVKVLDFGIAKELHRPGHDASDAESSLTTTGAMLGTLHYMAPEQVFGDTDLDDRADVWALGLVLYESISGKRPTQGSGSGQVLKAIMTGRFARLDELIAECPPAIADLVERMLSRERSTRPSMREVYKHLDTARVEANDDAPSRHSPRAIPASSTPVALDAPATTSTGVSRGASFTTTTSRTRRGMLGVALSAVIVLAGTGTLVVMSRTPEPAASAPSAPSAPPIAHDPSATATATATASAEPLVVAPSVVSPVSSVSATSTTERKIVRPSVVASTTSSQRVPDEKVLPPKPPSSTSSAAALPSSGPPTLSTSRK